jgi:oxygen-dependent protoporphyrinogen oxidase
LFPHRAPAGYHCLLNFIGGATDPAYVFQRQATPIGELTSEQRAEIVHQELSQILLKQRADPILLGDKLWQRAIPQYTVGHRQRLAHIQALLNPLAGLVLCGNYQDGVALGDCVKRAERQALETLAFLQGAKVSRSDP